MGTFKDDVESNLVHMRSLLRLPTPPFQRVPRNEDEDMADSNQAGASQGLGEATTMPKMRLNPPADASSLFVMGLFGGLFC